MRVLVSGSENISWNFYRGKQRSMMITNCIFRLGGVAFLMSNRPGRQRGRQVPAWTMSCATTWAPLTRPTGAAFSQPLC